MTDESPTKLIDRLLKHILQLGYPLSGTKRERSPHRLASAATILSPKDLSKLGNQHVEILKKTGFYLHDLRQVAGLTLEDLCSAIDLADHDLMKSVEKGTATLSFELILRLTALIARHDPVPFLMQCLRAYHPKIWDSLQDWGIGQFSLQVERERQFINILRKQDKARDLSNDDFNHLLELTESAFTLGLTWMSKQQRNEDRQPELANEPVSGNKSS